MTRAIQSQARYLSQAIQLEEEASPTIIRSTMMTVSLAILVFIGWSSITNINEIAHAPGEVTTQGFERVVQHLEGGIVKSILVHEGDQVEEGQVLMVLDGTGAQEDLDRALSKQNSLDMQEERMRAFTENRKADFSTHEKENPGVVRDQQNFFSSMTKAREEERKVIGDQIRQKERMIVTLRADLETAQNNYAITNDLYKRRESLNKKGYTSDIQFLQTRQSLNSINGDIKQLKNRISVANAEIDEFKSRLSALDAQYKDETNERLDQIIAEKAQNAELIIKLKDRVQRLEVRAPVRGVVKGLAFNTVGAVVQPGQTLMEIVPLDEQLIVEVRIAPQHIGHLKTGQDVEVKFSSFDFSRYGFVPGKLDQISATTFSGEKGERYYRGRVKLSGNHVGDNPDNTIMPGMTVMADIVTGQKTILDYLLKPIHNAARSAFTER